MPKILSPAALLLIALFYFSFNKSMSDNNIETFIVKSIYLGYDAKGTAGSPIKISIRENFLDPFFHSATITYGLRLVVFYPSMKSYFDFKDENYEDCAGYCNGRLFVYIKNISNDISVDYYKHNPNLFGNAPKNAADMALKSTFKNKKGIIEGKKEQSGGLLTKSYSILENGVTSSYFVSYEDNKGSLPAIFVECKSGSYVSYPSCNVYFSASSCAIAAVEVSGLALDKIRDTEAIVKALNAFLETSIQSKCNQDR